jgi:hypothetical protein
MGRQASYRGKRQIEKPHNAGRSECSKSFGQVVVAQRQEQ